MQKTYKKRKFNLFTWFKNLFVNPDKKKKPKRDWIKWFARKHYLNCFLTCLILDLIILLCIGFNFTKLQVSIPLIILCVPLGFMNFVSITSLIRYSLILRLVKKHNNEILNQRSRVDFRKGPPGCGKSTQTLYEARVLAQKCEDELTYKYWNYLGTDDSKLSAFKRQEKKEVIEAFEFYQREGTIPCLWSNVPCTDEFKRKANRLTSKHLLQEERLPYLSVAFNDEIGSEFEAQKGKTDKKFKNLSLFGRFIRHFIDGYWRLTEQDEKKSFIDIRRVVERVVMCLTQQWIMKPIFLDKIYSFFKNKRTNLTKKMTEYKIDSNTYNKLKGKVFRTSKRTSGFMRKFKHYIDCVGFRKYTVEEREYSESEDKILKSQLKVFYTPSCLNINYNDRCFHNLYKCKDKELKPSHFKEDFLTDEDIKEIYKEEDEKCTIA